MRTRRRPSAARADESASASVELPAQHPRAQASWASWLLLQAVSLSLVPAAQLALAPAGTPVLPRMTHPAWQSFLLLGLVPLAFFVLCASAWAAVDAAVARGWAPRLAACKLQGDWQPRAADYALALRSAAVSWLCVGLPFAWLLCSAVAPRLGLPLAGDAQWSPWQLAAHLPGFLLCVEVGFYASHRLLHTRALYKAVHAKHHEFSAPFALAAVHAHPLEHLVSNVAPISLGPLLLRSHPATAAAWACIAIFSTCGAHCGYSIPWLTRSPFHDHHHAVFTENFGVLGAVIGLDRWLGTSTRFRAKWAARAA
jgi:sterol desaturase/sphingolipid hydroxylase (fatty acid hydroxylase superfamily)